MKINEHLSMLKRSFCYLLQLDATYTILLVVTAILTAVIPYVSIYMSAFIVDELVGQHHIDQLILYAALTVGLTFLLHTINTILSKIRDYHQDMMYKNEGLAWADKTMALDYADIEDPEIHRLRERIAIENQTGYNLFYLYSRLDKSVGSISQIIASLALSVGLFANPSISLTLKILLVVVVIVVSVGNSLASSSVSKAQSNMMDECVAVNGFYNYISWHFGDYHSGVETRMYDMDELAAGLLRKLSGTVDDIFYRSNRKQLRYKVFSQFLMYGLQLAVYAFVIFGSLRGGITVGSIAKYVSCFYLLLTALQELISSTIVLLKNNEYLKTYFSFLDIPNKMYQGSLPVEKRAFCDGGDTEYEIEFRNVSFRYPGASTYALRNVNLKFKIGKKLAVVGMNGSGKTTFIKLMCRLYDPTEGEILLNGIDIRKYSYEEYLSVFSVVFQDYQLFAFSLGQNVASTVSYDGNRVRDCLKRAGFGDRLASLPAGLETCLYKDFDEKGVEISGGEAQKIALARALYKDAPFIILDEPTAALDPIAEAEVYSRFNDIAGDKTTIYISHRLSSCRFCDNIAVFHQGELVQMGSHEELIAAEDGKYAELWTAQAQWYV